MFLSALKENTLLRVAMKTGEQTSVRRLVFLAGLEF
jgi:hypothetical protein